LYVINADGTGERALTDDLSWVHWAPYWHLDGKHIVYTAADHGNPAARPNYDVYWMRVDDDPKPVNPRREEGLGRGLPSIQSTFLTFSTLSRAIPFPFRSEQEVKPKRKPVRLTFAPGQDVLPVISPDGKKLMWTSTRDGRQPAQLWIADFV